MIKVILTNCFNKTIEFSSNSPFRIFNTIELSENKVKLEEKQGEVGTVVYGKKVEARDVPIEGSFKENSNDRKFLLNTILPGSSAILRYIDTLNDLDVYLEGQVIRTPDISNTKNVQRFQFVFHAPYPYWKKSKKTVNNFYDYQSLFKFPMTFKSDELFYVSKFVTKQIIASFNESSSDVGFSVLVEPKGQVKGFSITNVLTQETIKMKDSFIIDTNDKFVITIDHKKIAFLLNGENVFKDVDKIATTYFKLHPGDNVLQYDAQSGVEAVVASISYTQELVGI